MPPKKPATSAKAEQKRQQKVIEDKTFGLKNKNKSRTVQKYVQSIQQSVKCSNNPEAKKKAAEAQARKEAKEAKWQREQELKALFKEMKPTRAQHGQDGDEDDEAAHPNEIKVYDEETGEYLWQPEDFAEVEADDTRLEEQLEDELAIIRARPASELTPVNEETFQRWRQGKREALEKEQQKKHARGVAEFQTKGHGITGKSLWQHDASIFVDDEDAQSKEDYQPEEVVIDEDLFEGEDEFLDEEMQ